MRKRQSARLLAPLLGALLFMSSVAAALSLDDLQHEIDAGSYTDAAQDSQQYLQDHPGNRDARFLHARALAGQGKTKDAINAFESLAADYPMRAEPANNLAVLYADQGDYAKARKWLEKALATQPAYATANRNLGDVYTALADLAYRKALSAEDVATKTPLTMLDRLYYAQESVAPTGKPAPAPPRPQPPAEAQSPTPPPTQAKAPPPKPAPEPDPEPKPQVAAAPEPVVEPPPPADNRRSVLQTVRAWAIAWSNQDYDDYIDFYADDFDPGDNLSRDEWADLRRARLKKPQKINIHIADPAIEEIDDDRVRVDFVQKYDSPRYSDQVKKQLLMQRTRAGWRILRETSVTN